MNRSFEASHTFSGSKFAEVRRLLLNGGDRDHDCVRGGFEAGA